MRIEVCHHVYSIKLDKIAYSGKPEVIKNDKDKLKELFQIFCKGSLKNNFAEFALRFGLDLKFHAFPAPEFHGGILL